MANSSIVSRLKDKIITEIINDEDLFRAIDSPTIKNFEDSDKLVGTHIFNYHQNPLTLGDVQTYLTVQVHIPNTYRGDKSWVVPKLEIWIISNERHMKVNNIPKITANRNDYISQLLDAKFNGRREIGESKNSKNNLNLFDKLQLINNTEGALASEYLYRQMIFEVKDLNDSLCEDWE